MMWHAFRSGAPPRESHFSSWLYGYTATAVASCTASCTAVVEIEQPGHECERQIQGSRA
eukprot:COSAG01_NODE_47689_length_388_cov_0.532872_1_plen_58_part_10